ncbi:DUF6603 domain-containing protein [Conexibacter woesei]|uniref:DUF6603 domain-containing protein n=1 Tax=Conexibacter woesei (strain DSM 14684 / CCUG 47730 / CIP 108061 / JCM 11494 / NBRC 100937 / ID131577) TaxID=469383 RepID=D3F8M8_CONWI|nr:DUF6603 domain-containing protein [Conexibacter woesei]ADB50992.1 hypothetical protein Cwoe_2571 [Conexibacter woesei DSM 14684]
MSLADLQAVLQRQVDASRRIVVSAQTLADARLRPRDGLDAILTRALVTAAPPEIAFSGTVPPPGVTTLALTGAGDFAGVRGASVAVTFTEQADGEVDARLVVALGASWRFGTFFRLLAGRMLEAMPLAGAAYAVTSALRDAFPWKGGSVPLDRGAAVAGTVTLDGPLGIVAGLLQGASSNARADLIGPVDPSALDRPDDGTPLLRLDAELAFGVAIPHFTLSRPRVTLDTVVEEGFDPYPQLAFATTLSIDGRPYGDFVSSIPVEQDPSVSLAWVPDRGAPLSPATIVRLLCGADFVNAIPPPLMSVFSAVTLQGLFADVEVGRTLSLTSVGATIGSSGPFGWADLSLESLTMGVSVLDPLGDALMLYTFTGVVRFFPRVFEGEFSVAVDYAPADRSLDVAAGFNGTVSFNRVVSGLSNGRLELPREWLSLDFEDFGVAFVKTGAERVEYSLYGAARAGFPLPFLATHVDSTFQGTVDSATQTYKLVGGLRVANSFFGGEANIVRGDVTLLAEWRALQEDYLNLRDAIVALALPAPDIPRAFDLGLASARLTYAVQQSVLALEASSVNYGDALFVALKSGELWRYLGGVQVNRRLDLANLPLIDHILPSDTTLAVEGIQALMYTALDEAAQRSIARYVQGPYKPEVPLADSLGARLALTLDVAGSRLPFALSVGGRRPSGQLATPGLLAVAGNGAGAEPSDGTVWFNIQQAFGPVSFDKVGVRYADGVLWFLMNASVSGGGLTIAVFGLGMGSPLTDFRPEFTIRGLGLTFERDPVAISGALVGSLRPLDFAGLLSLKVREIQVGAIGAYSEVENHPSFFLYAVLNAPLGGPPAFFVTGLAAGFGFNRRLVLPTVDKVDRFPFVQWAVGAGNPPSSNPRDIGAEVTRVVGELSSGGFVAPSLGQNWLALGVRFRSFELLDTFALLTLAFGTEVEIALLGLSTVQLPPRPLPPVAQAQLALIASFSPRSGLLAVSGQLTSKSWVLSERARLTGGFAFWTWFSGDHEGDFVVTLGGYSPRYQPPAHYPQVPRLGLDWKVTDELQITGNLYFALTSSAVMAGGGMSAVWQSGSVRAWFVVQADFLLVFQPFHYYISAGVQLGCSVRVNLLFTHVTISAHLGVGLEIWGPEFAGKAIVDLSIVSFTIRFGAGDKDTSTRIEWDQFVERLLPDTGARPRARAVGELEAVRAPPAIVQIQVADGLLQQLGEREGELNWVVNGAKLKLTTQTAIPAKRLEYSANIAAPPGLATTPNTNFGIGPTATASDRFASTHAVTIESDEDARFAATPLLRNIPKALWERRRFDRNGVPLDVDPVRGTTIDDVAVGCTLTGVGPDPEHTLPIPLRYLDYTTAPQVEPLVFSNPSAPSGDPFRDETVWGTVDVAPARANRPLLAAAAAAAGMEVPSALDVRELTSRTTAGLQASPRLRLLGEQR